MAEVPAHSGDSPVGVGLKRGCGCPCRKSNPSVLVMYAAENRSRLDASY
jgi:hypothetical protein